MGWFKNICRNEKGVTSVEMAVATPILAMLALSSVEVTSLVLFNQKMDRAVTAMGDLTAQARGLALADLDGLYDAAEYIMRPYDLDTNGTVIVSSISPDNEGNAQVNWQWQSATASSAFGSAGGAATLPQGFVVRDGESVIVSEMFIRYDPIFLDQFISDENFYQFAVFRPRYDALTALQ